MHKVTKITAIVSLASAISACGGSGGSSDNTLSQDPENQLPQGPVDPNGYNDTPTPILEISDLNGLGEIYNEIAGLVFLRNGIEQDLEYFDQSDDISELNELVPDADACSLRQGTVEPSPEYSQTPGVYEYNFKNCFLPFEESYVVLNGTMKEEWFTRSSDGAYVDQSTFNLHGHIGGEKSPFALVGKQKITNKDDGNNGFVTYESDFLEYLVGEKYIAAKNLAIESEKIGDERSFGINGTLIGSNIQGYIGIETVTKMQGTDNSACPDSGHLNFEGDGTAEVRFGENAAPNQGVEIFINNGSVEFNDECTTGIPRFGLYLL